MGCCVSSDSNRPSQHHSDSALPPRSAENRAPPLEEETVKEVLSETPKWRPPLVVPPPKFEPQDSPKKPKVFEKLPRERKVEKFEKEKLEMVAAAVISRGEEISEVSEVCSLSESAVSTATFTEEEFRQRVNRSPARANKNRSFSGEFVGRRDRAAAAGKSPARRSEQSSPAKRNAGSVRVVQSRDQLGSGVTRNHPRRRDAGENSGRRSRSPATRTDAGAARSVVGRSPSARRGTNQSPSRSRTAAPAPESGGRKTENQAMEGKWPSANESLENPLVSLECFIFL